MKMKEPGGRLGNSLPEESPAEEAGESKKEEESEPTAGETEGHMHTLMQAEHIKSSPIKMKAVHKLAGRHAKAITSIQDLKDVYQQKFGMKKTPGNGGV